MRGLPEGAKTPIQIGFGWGMGMDGDGWACLEAVTMRLQWAQARLLWPRCEAGWRAGTPVGWSQPTVGPLSAGQAVSTYTTQFHQSLGEAWQCRVA